MTVDSLVASITREIINPLILLLTALALIYFLWGVFTYVRNADNEAERQKGQQHMLWGIIGLAIMFGVQAIIAFVVDTSNTILM